MTDNPNQEVLQALKLVQFAIPLKEPLSGEAIILANNLLWQCNLTLRLEETMLFMMGGEPKNGDTDYWPRYYQARRVHELHKLKKYLLRMGASE